MERLPTSTRHASGLGVAASELGKRRRAHTFEEDGDEESDEESNQRSTKHDKTDLTNIGFAQSEKSLISDAMGAQEEGIKRYGDETGKWEEDDEKLEPFNLQKEMEDGHFDDEGVYVENTKEAADPRDAWLDDFEERNGGKFAKKDASSDEEEDRPPTGAEIVDMKKQLAALLTRGETCAKGLKRLRKEKAQFDTMTELADRLMNSGEYGIYQIPKEDLADMVDQALAHETKADETDKWEYKISVGDGAEVHGPFSSEHMQGWMDAGYFKEKPIWVRRLNANQPEGFKSTEEIEYFSMF